MCSEPDESMRSKSKTHVDHHAAPSSSNSFTNHHQPPPPRVNSAGTAQRAPAFELMNHRGRILTEKVRQQPLLGGPAPLLLLVRESLTKISMPADASCMQM